MSMNEESKMPNWVKLNNEILSGATPGQFNFEKDKEATRSYFVDHVNKKTVFFHDYNEKVSTLTADNYYDEEVFGKYSADDLKRVSDAAYSKKFRFPSYMSAFKFYNDYSLRTDDKKSFLERYEDRVVANALLFGKGDVEKALEFVEVLINQEFQPATPTFMNAGRKRRGELVSCFLLEVNDSLNDISRAVDIAMQLSKVGGGVSLNLSKIRAKGAPIKGVANAAKGVVGVMKLLDNAFRYADQMGQRQGSGSAYLNVFHKDINDFLDTKKISADEDVRVKTLSLGVVIPDKFIELAKQDKEAFVFEPSSVYESYGEHLDEIDMNEMYTSLVDNEKVVKEKINPRKLLEKLSILRSESGYPYIMFEDNVKKEHALNNVSKVKFSNLCSEVLQASEVSTYTNYGQPDDVGMDISCNLGSLNITNVMKNKSIERAVKLAIDALTVVARETNIENAPAVKKANEEMQSIGLGAMGLHGFLAQNGIAYESPQAIEFANAFFSTVNYWSLVRSNEIAAEYNECFNGFEGSTYQTGEFFNRYLEKDFAPHTEKLVAMFEGIKIPTKEDWEELKRKVSQTGLYHSYRLCIAPTGSISYVQSSTASVMPIMERIEERTYGNSKTYYPMPGLSAQNWFFYKEAYDMDMHKVVDLIAAIQQHVDQGISFTLFLKDTMTTRDLTKIDLYAHHKGIKTLYYARTKDTGQDGCLSCVV